MRDDPLVQKCMCPTYSSRVHAEKHYLFLPYRDIERDPNTIKIVVSDTSKSHRKSLGLSSRRNHPWPFVSN